MRTELPALPDVFAYAMDSEGKAAPLEVEAATARLPYPVLPVMVLLEDSTPPATYPRAVPLPQLDDGPHLSYAIQWFSFAAIALIGGGLWLRKQLLDSSTIDH